MNKSRAPNFLHSEIRHNWWALKSCEWLALIISTAVSALSGKPFVGPPHIYNNPAQALGGYYSGCYHQWIKPSPTFCVLIADRDFPPKRIYTPNCTRLLLCLMEYDDRARCQSPCFNCCGTVVELYRHISIFFFKVAARVGGLRIWGGWDTP